MTKIQINRAPWQTTAMIAVSIISLLELAGCGPHFQSAGLATGTTQGGNSGLTTGGSGGTSGGGPTSGSGSSTGGSSGSTSSSSGSSTGGSSSSSGTTSTSGQNLQNLGVIGIINGSMFGLGNVQVLSLDTVNKDLLLSLPIPLASLDGIGITTPLNEPPGATLGLQPLPASAGNGSALVLTIPLADIVKGGLSLPSATTLPNGMPIPNVPGGALPSFAAQLPGTSGVKATIYLSTNTVGIFIAASSLPLEISLPITAPSGGQTWGYVYSIPVYNKAQGGYFIVVQLPANIASSIAGNL